MPETIMAKLLLSGLLAITPYTGTIGENEPRQMLLVAPHIGEEEGIAEHRPYLIVLQSAVVKPGCAARGGREVAVEVDDGSKIHLCAFPLQGYELIFDSESATCSPTPPALSERYFAPVEKALAARARECVFDPDEAQPDCQGLVATKAKLPWCAATACNAIGRVSWFGDKRSGNWWLQSLDGDEEELGEIASGLELTVPLKAENGVTWLARRRNGKDHSIPLRASDAAPLHLFIRHSTNAVIKSSQRVLDIHFYGYRKLAAEVPALEEWKVPVHRGLKTRTLPKCSGPFALSCSGGRGEVGGIDLFFDDDIDPLKGSSAEQCRTGPPICPKALFEAIRTR